jgi:hypothetical protein
MRLVPNQDWEQITELFTKHFISIACSCWGNCKSETTSRWSRIRNSNDSLDTKQQTWHYTETFGVPAIPVRSGGSIPIVALFEKN